MKAYTGPVSKADFVNELYRHWQADQISQGVYWRNGRGCAIGCSIEAIIKLTGIKVWHSDHVALAVAIQVPVRLLTLQDRVHEGLSRSLAKGWPLRFAEAIPVGADLTDVARRVTVRMLRELLLPPLNASVRQDSQDGLLLELVTCVANGIDCGEDLAGIDKELRGACHLKTNQWVRDNFSSATINAARVALQTVSSPSIYNPNDVSSWVAQAVYWSDNESHAGATCGSQPTQAGTHTTFARIADILIGELEACGSRWPTAVPVEARELVPA